ncbi:MAG: EF-hand domain-containing protein [Verrucomicrobia bacterium]|nr:EF-hand domain-containing protein [Verrucomicrobiota bacterium]MCH8510480.1 EF-hand domain-containing protein [Kiritimatiellia bacterium]
MKAIHLSRHLFTLIFFSFTVAFHASAVENYHEASPEERAAIRARVNARRQAAMVERFDKDGDGHLTPEEYAASVEVLRQEWQQRQAKRRAIVEANQAKFRNNRDVLMIHRFDRNGDGRLSDSERQAGEETIRREQEAHRAKRPRR